MHVDGTIRGDGTIHVDGTINVRTSLEQYHTDGHNITTFIQLFINLSHIEVFLMDSITSELEVLECQLQIEMCKDLRNVSTSIT